MVLVVAAKNRIPPVEVIAMQVATRIKQEDPTFFSPYSE